MKKYVAEAFGTFLLVFIGCGAAVLAGAEIGHLGIAFAFGLGLITAAYIVGGISGCHINPAVTIGAWAAGRISKTDGIGYVIGQVIGAILGAFVVMLIAQGNADYTIAEKGLGQNGFGGGYLGEYNFLTAIIFEFVATLIFVTFIMEVTDDKNMSRLAGLLIGLVLVGIHIVGIQITGVSVNPARSIGPALFAGPYAWAQLPVFILAPLAGGLVGGFLNNSRILSASDKNGAGEKAIAEWTDKVKSFSQQATNKVKSTTASTATSAKSSAKSTVSKTKKAASSTTKAAGSTAKKTSRTAKKAVKKATKSTTKKT